jgi:hypothetical protein
LAGAILVKQCGSSIEDHLVMPAAMIFILLLLVIASLMTGILFLDKPVFLNNDFYII